MVQGIRSINGRYKIDRGRLRIAWEMGKPKNLCVLLGTVLPGFRNCNPSWLRLSKKTLGPEAT